MKILAYDKISIDSPHISQVSLNSLASNSDVITVHLELNNATAGILDHAFFTNIKQGAFLLNTSRGEILDEIALVKALENGILSGAALDVLSNETSKNSTWLINSEIYKYASSFDNLLITPHIGGVTYQSVTKTNDFIIRKLSTYLHESLIS